MQLLDSEQLEYALQAHGISLEGEARHFYNQLWTMIQAAEKIHDERELSLLSQKMRRLCRAYFSKVAQWRFQEEDRQEDKPDCVLSENNIREAKGLIASYEKQFFRYVLCYMELNRALIHNRARLGHFAKDYNIDDLLKTIEVGHATGILLSRAHRERQQIMEKRLRLERLKGLLQHFDGPLEYLGSFLPDLFGHDEGDRQITLFKGALRQSRFDDAVKIATKWNDPRVSDPALALTAMAARSGDELKIADKIILHSGELSLVMAFLKGDEERMNRFMEKYNLPYMAFQYSNLIRQGYLLGHVGSLEGLLVEHAKLSALAARKEGDPAKARMQEQGILIPVRQRMTQNFGGITAIFTEMETTCAILEKLFHQTREYERNAPAQ